MILGMIIGTLMPEITTRVIAAKVAAARVLGITLPASFTEIIDYASISVIAWGGVLALIGVTKMGEGKSNNNAAERQDGMEKIVGGAIIAAVGAGLVTIIPSLLS